MPRVKEDDLELLLPSVKAALLELRSQMAAKGRAILVFDTLRTAEEALRNAKRGTGIVNSVHCYGAAFDCLCPEHLWSCAKAKCDFYEVYGGIAESLGLVWGRRFKAVDLPHCQAVPVSQQSNLRILGMGLARAAERDALCRVWLAKGRAAAKESR